MVQHHPRVRQHGPLSFGSSREQKPGHAHAGTKADRADVRLQIPHRVVQRQGRHDLASRAVDVDADVLLGLGVEVEHGGDELVGELVVDGLLEEDDAVAVLSKVRRERERGFFFSGFFFGFFFSGESSLCFLFLFNGERTSTRKNYLTTHQAVPDVDPDPGAALGQAVGDARNADGHHRDRPPPGDKGGRRR